MEGVGEGLDAVAVTARVTGEVPRKPPLTELLVDLEVSNASDAAVWLLVARQAGTSPGEGGVDVLEVEAWGSAHLGSFLGTGGFTALRLAAGARVSLTGVRVRLWQVSEPAPTIELLLTPRLSLGGTPAESLFPQGDPAIDGELAAERGSIAHVHRFHPESREVPVELGAVRRLAIPAQPDAPQ